MQTDFENFFHRSEHQYLQESEINDFRQHIEMMRQRLATYEILREQEISLFQTVADQLEVVFPTLTTKQLEKVLKQWISIMRYCAFAMLLNNPEFLQHRLLEWLTDIVKAHQMQEIEQMLYKLLQAQVTKILSSQQVELLQPFLEQAQTTLFSESETSLNKAVV